MAHQKRRLCLSLKHADVELHSYHEHEEQDADLAKNRQRPETGGGEEELTRARKQGAEKRWPQGNTDRHLTDDSRLPESRE
jgi:hypothetical protein